MLHKAIVILSCPPLISGASFISYPEALATLRNGQIGNAIGKHSCSQSAYRRQSCNCENAYAGTKYLRH